eukprot:TRINITY_DN18060_c0_g1_i1.p1 TRINITY_DN18060_c0_g1~~TRINITY_DN18060_c0_g1_i1.p1  ORF type:complete len:122 (-),score=18.93 TRINITY_DN18060_c0_g1_i1:23-388(-)
MDDWSVSSIERLEEDWEDSDSPDALNNAFILDSDDEEAFLTDLEDSPTELQSWCEALPLRTVPPQVKAGHHQQTCAVCIEVFVAGDTQRVLPCTHVFHPECVDRWLSRRHDCPLCRCSIHV